MFIFGMVPILYGFILSAFAYHFPIILSAAFWLRLCSVLFVILDLRFAVNCLSRAANATIISAVDCLSFAYRFDFVCLSIFFNLPSFAYHLPIICLYLLRYFLPAVSTYMHTYYMCICFSLINSKRKKSHYIIYILYSHVAIVSFYRNKFFFNQTNLYYTTLIM